MEQECICGMSGTNPYCNENNKNCMRKISQQSAPIWQLITKDNPLPLNQSIIAKNNYTICAVQNYNGNWVYWHSNTFVQKSFIDTATHYFIPEL